jgi:hypothetical protein
MIVKGDAFMRPKDAVIAAAIVQLSLQQFLDAAGGKLENKNSEDPIASGNLPDTFNVCSNNFMPSRKADVKYML